MLHDCAITQHYAVLLHMPLIADGEVGGRGSGKAAVCLCVRVCVWSALRALLQDVVKQNMCARWQ